jgi:hypothetical protein
MSNDEIILTCLDTVRHIAFKYAPFASHLDGDDLLSIGYLAMVEDVRKTPVVNRAYLVQSAKWKILKALKWQNVNALGCRDQYAHVESLDAKLGGEETDTLSEVLPAPEESGPIPYANCEQALYDALRRLPVDEQEYLKHSYRLEYFEIDPNPVTGRKARRQRASEPRSHRSLHASAFQYLRKDARLHQAVQGTTA